MTALTVVLYNQCHRPHATLMSSSKFTAKNELIAKATASLLGELI